MSLLPDSFLFYLGSDGQFPTSKQLDSYWGMGRGCHAQSKKPFVNLLPSNSET